MNDSLSKIANPGELPDELDFFKTQNSNGVGKRKAEQNEKLEGKRRKLDEMDTTQDETQPFTGVAHNPQTTAHRVTTKGKNVPSHIDSFDELRKYSIPSHLYSNLASSGYKDPTSIQSYCLPILLEVG